jgi:hypothetical protein
MGGRSASRNLAAQHGAGADRLRRTNRWDFTWFRVRRAAAQRQAVRPHTPHLNMGDSTARASISKNARAERVGSILAGAHTATDQLAAWHQHLQKTLRFPFTATYQANTGTVPFCGGAILHVIGLAPLISCSNDALAKVMDGQQSTFVPFHLLVPRDVDHGTAQALADWRHWRASRG